ncbi:MAG: SDR family oxidoreductase [Pseudomonadota bacterium]
MNEKPVLVTGATGYVGGRLAPRLLAQGVRVRAIARNPAKLSCRPWASHPNLELVQADVMGAASLARALKGCRAAYYLVHSMNAGTRDFAAADRQAAVNMAAACAAAGLERIIYLGGLAPDDPHLSHHLRSRAEVAHILASGPTPVTWLRAAMILGSGSASFEIMRYLVERLPLMITPRWVRSRVQPIAITNVLGYLAGCLEGEAVLGRAFDIGGPDVLTYRELFDIYAQEAGLRRRVILPAPFFSPKLSSYWIHLVTPVPAAIARPLAEGLRNSVVCRDNDIREIIPQKLLTCRQAIGRALNRVAQQRVETCWMDAGQLTPPEWLACEDAAFAGGDVLTCAYRVVVEAEPVAVWPALAGIGGRRGWYAGQWLWAARGWLDRLLGGVGLGRGRRHPDQLRTGDALDFWRVLEVDPPRRLLLLAEMKMPGQAVLDLRLMPAGPGQSEIQQVARFLPRGLMGLAYWYAVLPLHALVFAGMLKALARRHGWPVAAGPEAFDPAAARSCKLPGS